MEEYDPDVVKQTVTSNPLLQSGRLHFGIQKPKVNNMLIVPQHSGAFDMESLKSK
jgi:hypothetical protein